MNGPGALYKSVCHFGACRVSAASMSHGNVMHPQSASSERLGFRPPQFSDDVAWLPNWLQPHVATMAFGGKDEEQDPQNRGACSVKEVGQSRGSIYRDKDSSSLLIKDTRKEGLRLHLSGDDDSPVPGTSCSEKVPQFTLHLSTDGSSGSCFFPVETSQDKSMTRIEQSVEDIQGSGDLKQLKIESNHGSMNLFSSTSYQNKSPPKPNSKNSEDQEIRDAVEHSTAASEALVIYELIKGEPSSSINILELALKVKQTRLEWLNDILTFSNSNDSEMLSDLDDSEMEDAYGDVGLSCSRYPNITSVSQVAETLISRQNLGEDGAAGSKQKSQENVTCTNDAEEENHDYLDLIPSIACGDDLMMHQRTSDEINAPQMEDAKLKGTKHFQENLTVTSYLSESADVPPDLNSCINTHNRSSKFSQSSIKIEGLYREEKNGASKDSNMSSVDPLCSVIPCSVDEEMMPEFDLEAENMPSVSSCHNEIISSETQENLNQSDTTPQILCAGGARHRVQAHKQYPVDESLTRFDPKGILQNPHIQDGKFPDTTSIQTRKRVRFNDEDVEYQKKRDSVTLASKYGSRKKTCCSSQEVKEHLTNFDMKDKKKRIFRGLEFLLTGFPCKKEKEVERILRRYGGAVLADIPSPQKKGKRRIKSDSAPLPIVICTKKLRTRKFLYGCTVSAFLLHVDWILDSIQAGSVIQPEKYLILPNQQHRWTNRIRKTIHLRTVDLMFYKVGIMLHGEHVFCLKLAEVIKHGQGCVYKSLQGMVQSLKNKNISVGIIIADNESYATRHLRECASEQNVPVMSTSWIINCIYRRKLLPFEENNSPSRSAQIEIQPISASQEWTQEI